MIELLGLKIPDDILAQKAKSEEYAARREKLITQAGAKPADWHLKANFDEVLKRATESAGKKQFDPALKLLDEAEKLLQQPDTAPPPAPAPAAPAPKPDGSPDIIEIPKDQKKDFDKRMKLVEGALKKSLKGNPLPQQLPPAQMRQFVEKVTACAAGNPKNIEKEINIETNRFVRKARKTYAQRQVAAKEDLTEEELAELIVTESEDLALGQATGDTHAVAEADPKKHQKMVKELAKTLKDPKFKSKTPKKANAELVEELSKAMAGDKAKGVLPKARRIIDRTREH